MLAYRCLLTLASPVLLLHLLWRRATGRDSARDLRERLGGGAPGAAGALWLHGASVGELTAARALITALLHHGDAPLVVTANTAAGRDLVASWSLPRTAARLAPLDLRPVLGRFRRAWRPRALIVLENELWPNRILTARGPVLAVGARMSVRSFRRWHRLVPLAARVLGRLDAVFPQDAASARHLAALGLPKDRLSPPGSLKSGVVLPAPDADALARLRQVFDRADTLLAASTHEGEDEIVLDALRASRPALKLILAPRHPARGDALALLCRDLPTARRSRGEMPDAETRVLLADTLGEMPLWYALAGVTFVGGSLVPRGGHTPFEPAAAGSAILHGPDTANFAAPFAALDAGGGAQMAMDAQGLDAALQALADPAAQAAQARRAAEILARLDSSTTQIKAILARLDALLAR